MTTHELKCWPEFFGATLARTKRFEVRKGNDRKYERGDRLWLREWDPATKEYTGDGLYKHVTYVMHGGPLLPDDLWVIGFDDFA